MDPQQTLGWLRRLANLEMRVFDEVGNSPNATISGVVVALGANFLAGIGGWLWWNLQDYPEGGAIFVHSAVLGSLVSLVLWAVWVALVHVILAQVFRARAYLEQLLRVMGLAMAPLGFSLLMVVPGISMAVGLASLAATFALTCFAIQRVTTADPGRVLAANSGGFLVWATVLTLLTSTSGARIEPHAPGVFLYNTTASIIENAADAR